MKQVLTILSVVFLLLHTYGQADPMDNRRFTPEVPQGVLTNEAPLPGMPQTTNPFKEINHPSYRRQPVEQKSEPAMIGGDIEGAVRQLEQSKQKYYSKPVPQVPVREVVLPDNIDRFTSSPCYEQIGFRPGADPKVMEKIYSDCERGKKSQEVKGVGTVVVIVAFLVALVLMGLLVTTKKKAEG